MSDATNKIRQRGLTLIETLVALTILATVAVSALALLSQSTRFVASEQDRLVAAIVADNLLVKELAKLATPPTGVTENVVEMSGREWAYQIEVVDIGERARLMTVKIRREGGEQVLTQVSGVKEVK